MLEMRSCCENCGIPLPPNSREAMICSFECTFCRACAENLLANICPNCGGGLSPRPTRDHSTLDRYPPTTERVYRPVDLEAHALRVEKMRAMPTGNR